MNFVHEIAALKARVEQLERTVEEATAGLAAGGAAVCALTHVLITRAVLDSSDWRAALSDIARSAELEMGSLPIAGPHAQQIRAYAQGLINGSISSVSDGMEAWEDQGMPGLEVVVPVN